MIQIFQRWQQGATIVSTNPNYVASPSTTTTYVGYWNCGGLTCSDDTIINVVSPAITVGAITNNSNCLTPNGTFTLNFNNFNPGTYTLNYFFY